MHFKVGSRASLLALKQTNFVIDELNKVYPNFTFEIVNITSTGDKNQNASISGIGVEGVFVKELEEALVKHDVDFVVHSLKDMPTLIDDKFELVSVLNRIDKRDVLVSPSHTSFNDLKPGSIIGTASIRRTCQLKALRTDLTYKSIRGNLPTRLKKLEEGYCDALIIAAAGLERLNLTNKITQYFEFELLTPPAGQGALAVECLANNFEVKAFLKSIDNELARAQIISERVLLAKLGGGCSYPIGAVSWIDHEQKLHLLGCVASLDGNSILRHAASLEINQARELGNIVAIKLIEAGALKLLGRGLNSISN